MLVLNLLMAITWMALNQAYTLVDFFVGFIFSFAIIAISQRCLQSEVVTHTHVMSDPAVGYVGQVWRWATFLVFALWSVIKSNIEVARIVLSPTLKIQPGIVAIPLDVKSEAGITLLANLITLTPGTVTLHVSEDRKTLYIHTLNVDDADALRRDTKEQFERRVMELFP